MPHIPRRISVVDIILPNPTSGETMLPDRKPTAPKTAEAVPIALRPSSIASVVAEVKINPTPTSMVNVNISYGQNDGIKI